MTTASNADKSSEHPQQPPDATCDGANNALSKDFPAADAAGPAAVTPERKTPGRIGNKGSVADSVSIHAAAVASACISSNSTSYATEATNMPTSAKRASTSGLAAVAADLSPIQEDDTNTTAPLPRHSRFLQLLTVAQAAQRLHTTTEVILAAVAKNDLQPDLKIGNSMRFRAEELDVYVARCVERVALAPAKSADAGTAELVAVLRELAHNIQRGIPCQHHTGSNLTASSPSAFMTVEAAAQATLSAPGSRLIQGLRRAMPTLKTPSRQRNLSGKPMPAVPSTSQPVTRKRGKKQ